MLLLDVVPCPPKLGAESLGTLGGQGPLQEWNTKRLSAGKVINGIKEKETGPQVHTPSIGLCIS